MKSFGTEKRLFLPYINLSKRIDIVSSTALYSGWSGSASAMIQQFIQVVIGKHGDEVQIE